MEQDTNQQKNNTAALQTDPIKPDNKRIVLIIILVTTLTVVSCLAIYFYTSNKLNQQLEQKQAEIDALNAKVAELQVADSVPKNKEFSNAEINTSLTYPLEWGNATLSDGKLVSPQTGKYKTLTFSNQPKISINYVLAPYSSPLDGCVSNPVYAAEHGLYGQKASVVGWETDYIKRYMTGQGFNGPTIYKESLKPKDDGPDWLATAKTGKTLEYKATERDINKWKAAGPEDVCGYTITQAQADAANAFDNIYYYAVNYAKMPVYGANATFDTRSGDDNTTRNKLIEVLNTIK